MKKKFNKTRKRGDTYAYVTNRIVADLKQGVRSWAKPWDTEHLAGNTVRPLRHNGLPYSGINILMLWTEAMDKGFSSPLWMTYKQASELEAHVPER